MQKKVTSSKFTYDDAISYLEGLGKSGIRPGLSSVKELFELMDCPARDIPLIQVVGTNGKGSVSTYISGILRAAGFKVGLYSSPAVFDDLEIIRVNGRNISKADFTDIISKISALDHHATRFEVETVAALSYFGKKQCDFIILEAGMGGGDDATNLFDKNLLSVFASIGLDHTEYLGDTVGKIAANKAGVIKPDSSAVSAVQAPEAADAIIKAAREKKAELSFVEDTSLKNAKFRLSGTVFDYKEFKGLKTSRLGTFQPINAALAIEATFKLRKAGFNISDKAVYAGIESAFEAGRFEKIGDKPPFYIDGAHNEPAARSLMDSVETYFTKKEIVYIMGMFRDKACEKVAEITASRASHIITVTLPNRKRSMTAVELGEIVSLYNPMVSAADSIEEAVELAGLMAGKDSVILAFGSLSFLKEIKKIQIKKTDRRHRR